MVVTFGWKFARLMAPVVTTTSIILSSNKIHSGDILIPVYLGCPAKWPLNEYHVWFNATKYSLSIHLTPHIHLTILISAHCNANLFVLFTPIQQTAPCAEWTFPWSFKETSLAVRNGSRDQCASMIQNSSTNSTLKSPSLSTQTFTSLSDYGPRQGLHKNDLLALQRMPFTLLHLWCTNFMHLVHCIELQLHPFTIYPTRPFSCVCLYIDYRNEHCSEIL